MFRGLKRWMSTTRSKGSISVPHAFPLVLGGELPCLEIQFEQWGDPKLPAERTIMILPSFSHSSHAASNSDDPSPGWWQDIIGPGKPLNTSIFRIICASVLGSPYGTTSPLAINPVTGQRYAGDFPQITTADMAACHAKVLDHLKLDKIHAVIGGSLGGMQALEFAAQFPDRVKRLIALSFTAQTTPGTVACRRVQRRAIMADPNYKNGNYRPGHGPVEGMRIARELGMTSYRSREEFDARFDWKPTGPPHYSDLTFDVESYMDYQGEKFARVYDPNCYLLLSRAADLTDLGRGYISLADGLRRIEAESLLFGVEQDLLIPIQEQQCVHQLLASFGRKTQFIGINTKYGHDGMFHGQLQEQVFGPPIKSFLQRDFERLLELEHQRYSTL